MIKFFRHPACLLSVCLLAWVEPTAVQAEEEKATEKTAKPASEEAKDGKPSRSEIQARARRAGVATQVWLDVLRHEDLTQEQKNKITPLVRSWLKEVEVWNEGNGKVLSEATKEARALRAEAAELPAALRSRISELRKLRPTPWAMQKKVWNLLSESQQQAFRFNLDEAKKHGFAVPIQPRTSKDSRKPTRAISAESKPSPSKPANKDAGKARPKAPEKKPWSFIN